MRLKELWRVKAFVEALQSLADPTRLRIVRLLADSRKELCVCELVDALESPQYNVSRHLRVLRQAGLVTERKEGRWVYYGLSPGPDRFRSILVSAIQSIPESTLAKDRKELAGRLKIREGGKCLKGILKSRLNPALGR
ncbi:MAG: winged helix-turn-helix transcriptional regulator [Nitrospirae bacterium]|nr:winged helix-turn-helix transcriptional regulator [Nitrospirota bacterium]